MEYKPNKIEKKWQELWEGNKTFLADEKSNKDKFYGLVEFPYPSGDGLHTGHLRSYTALDIVCRWQRMLGKEVLYPMGMDAFGLPTENYAVKNKIAPQEASAKNIANFNRQLKQTGYSFDWSRYVETIDPKYYKWTQWIFIQMFKKGLAYKATETINWCTSCKIGLANEEVIGGVCERCGGEVVKKAKEQWMLKITDYADRLLADLDKVDFLDKIKTQQSNWIGKSQGAEVDFVIKAADKSDKLTVFTTRPDTLFGATFMVVAPEQDVLQKFKDQITNFAEVKKYIDASQKKSDLERSDLNKDKTGVELQGLKAINPVNNKAIPIYVADYVMMNYGTGAIMAVPAHDQRDWEFATKYKLEIIPVVEGGDISQEAFVDVDNGQMINSGEFDDLKPQDCITKITKWLEGKKLGQAATNYKLRDWIFSRQRYWGEPIPMVFCEKCGWEPVDEDQLPVTLPDIEDFMPTDEGESPLAKINEWTETTCPKCGGTASRETDVMPNWAGSNWYFVRYCDAKNDKALVDGNKAKHWLPVDWYNGGMEHTTLHLLYSRFVFKFLYDIGVVPPEVGDEPYKKRTAQGMILGEGGVKMSKSKGNVVNPDIYIEKYGADTTRLYIMFMGPFDQDVAWDDKGVIGLHRFLNKVWNLQNKLDDKVEDTQADKLLHQTIKKVGDDVAKMNFNTAISQLMILVNYLDKQKNINKKLFSDLVLILSPFAPHISEELWQILDNKDSLAHQAWPKFDPKLAQEDNITLGIQINGKVRDEISLPLDTEPSKEIEQQVLDLDKIKKAIDNKPVKKFIHVKNRIISIVV